MSVIEKLDSVLADLAKWKAVPMSECCQAEWQDLQEAAACLIRDHGPAIRQAMIDARRYRFLRRKDAWKETYFATTGGISAIFVSDGRTGHATDTETLDAAIDARLASDSEGPEADSGGDRG